MKRNYVIKIQNSHLKFFENTKQERRSFEFFFVGSKNVRMEAT